ncbi:MAG: SDR family oxidoreductase [Candidatus Babeliales bacterium]|nr:SDR family oxidoreductase [Candidatus Babeliales bacterium]
MKKTIFLTGSKGFIGSHLLPKLIELGYNVTCAEHNEVPDYRDYFNYIIHLAAVTTTSDSFIPELFESNIIYAKQIMDVPTRIIYASSTSAAELSNPYAYTKRYIEHLGSTRNSTGLRFFNVYGPGNNKGIVKKAIECLKTGQKMQICGGEQIRDFIYIDDVCKSIISALDSKEKIIEVGTGTGISIYEALATIVDVFGGKLNIDWLDTVKTDMVYSVASPGIHNCLSFEEGLKKML